MASYYGSAEGQENLAHQMERMRGRVRELESELERYQSASPDLGLGSIPDERISGLLVDSRPESQGGACERDQILSRSELLAMAAEIARARECLYQIRSSADMETHSDIRLGMEYAAEDLERALTGGE